MKETDYSEIASRYDGNELRHDISRDANIERLYSINSGSLTVLDLACGTGNYLVKQTAEYRDYMRHSWVYEYFPSAVAIGKSAISRDD